MSEIILNGLMVTFPVCQLTGRTSDDSITICDLPGSGIQNTAIADHINK